MSTIFHNAYTVIMSLVEGKTAEEHNCVPLTYSPKWANGTGYFDHAVSGEHAPNLPEGARAACMGDDGRRIIIIGTAFGNAVVFERFTNGSVIVSNVPREVTKLLTGGSIGTALQDDETTLTLLLGSSEATYDRRQWMCPNVGMRIQTLRNAFGTLSMAGL